MKRFQKEIEVRYAETDMMGVVYHANYLVWAEVARTHLVEQVGFSWPEMEKNGIVSPVLQVNFSYKKAAHYGEKVTVTAWVAEYNGFRVTYGYEFHNQEGELLCEGTTHHVLAEAGSLRPIRMDRRFPELHARYLQICYAN